MSRHVWAEPYSNPPAIVVDLTACAAAGIQPDRAGRITIPLDLLGIVGFGGEWHALERGVLLRSPIAAAPSSAPKCG